MRQDGWTLSEQHPDFLWYDIENDKLCVHSPVLFDSRLILTSSVIWSTLRSSML